MRIIIKNIGKVLLFIIFLSSFTVASSPSLSGESLSRVIGWSVEGLPIRAHRVGFGNDHLILIGGIHGGYEWNTVLLSRQLLDYFKTHHDEVPKNISLHIITNANPDGLIRITRGRALEKVDFSAVDTRPGRFNGNNVDLNRNWDFRWEPKAYWGTREVDPGSAPFSEPETRALRDFILTLKPAQVVFFHSAARGIYYGGKREGYEPAKKAAEVYSRASGYPLPQQGQSLMKYPITGAASNYLYSKNISSITIELATHSNPEYSENLKGVKALLAYLEKEK